MPKTEKGPPARNKMKDVSKEYHSKNFIKEQQHIQRKHNKLNIKRKTKFNKQIILYYIYLNIKIKKRTPRSGQI